MPDGYYLITHFAAGASRLKDTILPDLVDENLDLRDQNAMYKLIDTNGSLRDVADDGEGLPLAGKAAPYYVSMERNYKSLKDGTIKASWQDSIGLSATYFDAGFDGRGTPGAQNSPAK